MSRASVAFLGVFALLPACFDPFEPAVDDTTGTSGVADTSTDATVGSPTSAGDPSGDPSTDPSGDPSTDPTTETTDDPTTAESSGGPTSSATAGDSTGDSTGDATDESTSESNASASESSSESESGEPVCAGQCAPAVPDGWQGPVVINEDDDADPCPAAFPQLVHGDQHAELSPGDASCDCDCGDVVGASCGSVTMQQTNALCTINQGGADVLPPNMCTFVSNGAGTYAITTPSLQVGGASCQPQASESIDEPSWGRDVRSCSVAATDECDGNCLPSTPDDHAMCIWIAGESACPAGAWTQQVITYGDVDDDRDCTACTCGAPTGTCGGNIELNNQGCGVIYIGDATPGTCGLQPAASHATYVPQVNASCTPSGGSLVGGVEPTDAITYCCL